MAAPEASLEALVRDELRGPVQELVQRVVVALVHEQLTGAAPAAVEVEAVLGFQAKKRAPAATSG